MATNLFTNIQQGFLLSRSVQDHGEKLHITLWLKTLHGAKKLLIKNEFAVFFVEEGQSEQAAQLLYDAGISLSHRKSLSLKTFNQVSVEGFYFTSLARFYRARDLLKTHKIKCYEDDIRPDDRFLMERFITSYIDFLEGDTSLNAPLTQCKRAAHVTPVKLTMLSLDIECSMSGALYSVGLYANNDTEFKCVIMIGEPQQHVESYILWVENEKQLLQTLIKQIQLVDADIFIGWNVINFDFSLLQKRCDLYDLHFAIGRDESAPRWRKNNNNTEQYFIEIAGRVVLDGIDLMKTATYSFPSFSLDYVANALLGIGKKVDDVDNRVQEITDNFNHNKPALAAYNLEDCRLVWLIFKKTQLLAFAQLRAQLTGLAIDRIGGSVAAFTNLYLPKLHRAGYIAPNMGDGASGLVSPGGYVMDSIPGLYHNVLVLDFKSLYPSIIRTFNIDPMGLVEGLLDFNADPSRVISGYDGAYFSRTKHFLPDIIRSLWAERDKAKLDKNAALSQAIKIIMNSFYGVLGSTGCRFFDPRLSGSITKRSHQILKQTKAWLEQQQNFTVIYGDTDSIFVHIDKANGKHYSQRESLAIGEQLQNEINVYWKKKLTDDFNVRSELEIEFETHFTRFFMPTIRGSEAGSKKRYAGLVLSIPENEDEKEQKIIFKGLESVRTDWTELAKEFQQELYHRVFNELPVKDYIITTVNKVKEGFYDEKLIYRKRLRRKLSHYVKNIPPQVKAARFADALNQKQGKPLKYQNRGWIEYYMTLNGPQAKEHLSASLDYQFYIDRQLEAVADAILPFIGSSFTEITDSQMGLF